MKRHIDTVAHFFTALMHRHTRRRMAEHLARRFTSRSKALKFSRYIP